MNGLAGGPGTCSAPEPEGGEGGRGLLLLLLLLLRASIPALTRSTPAAGSSGKDTACTRVQPPPLSPGTHRRLELQSA